MELSLPSVKNELTTLPTGQPYPASGHPPNTLGITLQYRFSSPFSQVLTSILGKHECLPNRRQATDFDYERFQATGLNGSGSASG